MIADENLLRDVEIKKCYRTLSISENKIMFKKLVNLSMSTDDFRYLNAALKIYDYLKAKNEIDDLVGVKNYAFITACLIYFLLNISVMAMGLVPALVGAFSSVFAFGLFLYFIRVVIKEKQKMNKNDQFCFVVNLILYPITGVVNIIGKFLERHIKQPDYHKGLWQELYGSEYK